MPSGRAGSIPAFGTTDCKRAKIITILALLAYLGAFQCKLCIKCIHRPPIFSPESNDHKFLDIASQNFTGLANQKNQCDIILLHHLGRCES